MIGMVNVNAMVVKSSVSLRAVKGLRLAVEGGDEK
jgi:hypothetical protein